MQHSTGYIIRFALGVCLVCALLVALSAVGLRERQEANILLDRQKKVLAVAGLMEDGQRLAAEEVAAIFASNMQAKVIHLETGEIDLEIDPASFDQTATMTDPATSKAAPPNRAKVQRLPNHGLVFDVVKDGELSAMILPIEGKGLWST
ncbi:MAG: Na(+)-translocating NADH-quinone reductase subunit C, partial [Deltaproteobacteria bacterium]|nr:Na(+)-translocating NADH-quinone reductase subunit C [Deltaproteobacteria bacterium]